MEKILSDYQRGNLTLEELFGNCVTLLKQANQGHYEDVFSREDNCETFDDITLAKGGDRISLSFTHHLVRLEVWA